MTYVSEQVDFQQVFEILWFWIVSYVNRGTFNITIG